MPKRTHENYPLNSSRNTKLYNKWFRIRRFSDDPVFQDYESFCKWAEDTGYVEGQKLVRLDTEKAFGTDNCIWINPDEDLRVELTQEQKRAQEWDEVVNRIRRHYGMEPIFSVLESV